jgi:septal ring factor EnvC (AmiA/AmiB activator)
MGLMDKVKSAADKAMTEAKKGTAQIKEKVGDAQLRRKADDAAKRLGYLIVKERAEGAPAGEEADKLVEEIQALETQIAEEAASAADAEAATEVPAAESAATETPSSPPDAPAGDFKLE